MYFWSIAKDNRTFHLLYGKHLNSRCVTGRDHYPEKQYLPTTAGNSQSQPHLLHEDRGVLPAKWNCDTKEHQMLFLICHLRKRGGKGGGLHIKANTTMVKNHSKVCKPHIPITHGNSRGNLLGRITYSRPKIINSRKK